MSKIVFHDSSLYPKPLSLYCLPRVYARVGLGLTPSLVWYITETLLPAKRRFIVSAYFLLVNLLTWCKNCSCKCSDIKHTCVLLPRLNAQPDISAAINCCVVALSAFSSDILTWSADIWVWIQCQGRTKGGEFRVKTPLSLIFSKTLLPAQRRLIFFAYILLVNFST